MAILNTVLKGLSALMQNPEVAEIDWPEFLISVPPTSPRYVRNVFVRSDLTGTGVDTPDIVLYCHVCEGERNFGIPRSFDSQKPVVDRSSWILPYICRNCNRHQKTYAIQTRNTNTVDGVLITEAVKIGEWPAFGQILPSRLITLIGPDRDLFLKGKRAEDQGLGIGAYAYYRRIVENQKGRIIDEVARVAKISGASTDDLARFKSAAAETQFKKAIGLIKDVIPARLMIGSHNPLLLLHSALSEQLHNGTDEEALELASEIRTVLTRLSENITSALEDEAVLRKAMTRLSARKT